VLSEILQTVSILVLQSRALKTEETSKYRVTTKNYEMKRNKTLTAKQQEHIPLITYN
jgi:hypothetical protein